MEPEERREITDRNEKHVESWFKSAGFKSERLDVASNKKPTADWHFCTPELSIVCEVKTIFSGGQSGQTREQYARRVKQSRQQLDRAKQETAPNRRLIVRRDELDFAEGRIPYLKPTIFNKEDAYNQFLEEIRKMLLEDTRINSLPFYVRISFSSLYVEYRQKCKQEFIDWLVGFILWAQNNHPFDSYPYGCAECKFTFVQACKDAKGRRQRGVEAYVQISGPYEIPGLAVGFPFGGTTYNEQGVQQNLGRALSQLKNTTIDRDEVPVLKTIGVWSHSANISLFRLGFELVGLASGETPERYNLFDWIFEEKKDDLAAIIFFELRPAKPQFGGEHDPEKLFPFGVVITNPYCPDTQALLNKALSNYSKHCNIIPGIKSPKKM